MATTDVDAFERQAHALEHVNALDQATALRVTRLVVECGASLAMALLAVQEADREVMVNAKRRTRRRGPKRILAFI